MKGDIRKVISVILKDGDKRVLIGKIDMLTNVVGAINKLLEDEIYHNATETEYYMIAKVCVDYHEWYYLYMSQEFKDGFASTDIDFYFVSIPQLYDENGYKSEVVVGEKFRVVSIPDALQIFHQRCIERMS